MHDVASVLLVVYHAAHAAVDSTLLTQVSAVVFVVDVGEGAVAAAGGEGAAAVVCTAGGQVGGAVAVDVAVVVLLLVLREAGVQHRTIVHILCCRKDIKIHAIVRVIWRHHRRGDVIIVFTIIVPVDFLSMWYIHRV